ncbi:SDR family oxidoreductase [Aureimonas sp. D3]|uniref:SDR family oxidoreductase n=1 Tax=Aureimonas sp. D3 TaxID=1638164 RepID=UPI000784EFA7|nr:SDR family oxidoreductase [Aureimonas sp. D3]
MKLLILGGYGTFGGRLATLLADVEALHLLIAGRSLVRAEAFCAVYRGEARVQPLALDRAQIADALAAHRPDLVVDASGPFQDYGDDPYPVIEACLAAGVDYLDFADAADFVFGVSCFDARAKAAGVSILSGVSSFPVLTAAVLREIGRSMEIRSVEGGIAPSPFAGIGLNVMRAVVSYAGGPVKLRRGGRPFVAKGLTESRRFTIAVPGQLPLRSRRFSLVDVPDLQVIPPEHPGMSDIWMGAGPIPGLLHRILNGLARARARFGLPALTPLSPLFYAVLNRMRFGEHRGGMIVRVTGTREGREIVKSWHLLAEGDDGPFIPSMAIEALIRKRLKGERSAPGARSAVHALDLADYDALFQNRAITTGFREERSCDTIYRRVLGPAFDTLPPVIRALHGGRATSRWVGTAEVRRGQGLAARLICALTGFPRTGDGVPASVIFAPDGEVERWTRRIGGKTLRSVQWAGTGRDQFLLIEKFGIARFSVALLCEGDRLRLVPRRWTLAGLPMPACLLPGGEMIETAQDDRFVFDIDIRAPWIGPIVHYRGSLSLEAPRAQPAESARNGMG